MSQETKIMFNVVNVALADADKISRHLGFAPSRVSVAVIREKNEAAWNYDIVSGSFCQQKLVEDALNQFLEANATKIIELGRTFNVEINILITDDEIPSLGRVSLSSKTLGNLGTIGLKLMLSFTGPDYPATNTGSRTTEVKQ